MNVPRRLAVLVAVMVFAGGLAMPARAATSTIGILVYDGFLTSDVTAPVEVLVVTVSTTKQGVVHSEEGLTILADKTIYDPLSLDVLIVPSAYKMDGVLKNTDVINFIKQQGRSASWMASNCSGARLLSEAGILDGKHATTWAGGEKALAEAYPKIKVEVNKNVVVDDKVITSNGGSVSYQAALELLARLSSEKYAQEISRTIQFDRLRDAFK